MRGYNCHKKSKFTESQIIFSLKQETGVTVAEVCRKMGISEATFYAWKKKYGGLGTAELRRLRQLEDENSRLEQVVLVLMLDKQVPQDVQGRSGEAAKHLRNEYRVSIGRLRAVVLLHRSVDCFKEDASRLRIA